MVEETNKIFYLLHTYKGFISTYLVDAFDTESFFLCNYVKAGQRFKYISEDPVSTSADFIINNK